MKFSKKPRCIIATKNKGKFREIKAILRDLPLKIISLDDLDKDIEIKETGRTFYENALNKALVVSEKYPYDFVIGEDSGLEISYLRGLPGIYSRRYAGFKATDLDNNLKLLKELSGIPRYKRKARFVCTAVLMRDRQLIQTVEGKLSGIISEEMRGKKGFGYDSIFYLPRYKKTVAQLSLREKNRISHRSKAFHKLKLFLIRYLRGEESLYLN